MESQIPMNTRDFNESQQSPFKSPHIGQQQKQQTPFQSPFIQQQQQQTPFQSSSINNLILEKLNQIQIKLIEMDNKVNILQNQVDGISSISLTIVNSQIRSFNVKLDDDYKALYKEIKGFGNDGQSLYYKDIITSEVGSLPNIKFSNINAFTNKDIGYCCKFYNYNMGIVEKDNMDQKRYKLTFFLKCGEYEL